MKPSEGSTVIGKSVIIRGGLSGNEDLFIDGDVEGTVTLPESCLTIGPNARVRADVSVGGRETRGSRMNRTAFSERTSGEARLTRGNGDFRGGTSGEIRARGSVESRGGASGEIRGTVGRGGGAAMRAGSSSGGRRGGDETR